MPRMTVPAKPTCIHCGTVITSITHRLNDGHCMPRRDPEGIALDDREGLVLVRNRRCAMRVRQDD